MEIFLLAFIVITQNTAVFLDNYAIFYLTSHKSNKVATVYTKKFQIDFLCRGFLFFTPPLLGLMLIQDNLFFLLLCLLISSIVTLALTFFQSFIFVRKMKINFHFPLTKKNLLLLLIGLVIYAIYLYVPFYLNIISYFFKGNSLWIVQLSPALTAVSSVFVVYYMDPKVAKFIDAKPNEKNPGVLSELIAIRILGRFIILFASILLFIKLV